MTTAPEQTRAQPDQEDAAFYEEAASDLVSPSSYLTVPCVHCGERIRKLTRRGDAWIHDDGQEVCGQRS